MAISNASSIKEVAAALGVTGPNLLSEKQSRIEKVLMSEIVGNTYVEVTWHALNDIPFASFDGTVDNLLLKIESGRTIKKVHGVYLASTGSNRGWAQHTENGLKPIPEKSVKAWAYHPILRSSHVSR